MSAPTNVSWVWCPYVNNGDLPFMDFYPGNEWVDWLALDGFNWGSPIAWQSFPKIFDALLPQADPDRLEADHDRRDRIQRIGREQGHWLRRTLRHQLPRLKRVRAVVWFDAPDGADFRVNSSAAALSAFREGIGSPLYSGGRELVERISRRAARLPRLGR